MATRPTEELIIDRTLSDVNNLRTKGNYNATDLNRVEKWCKYLMELLSEYGYYVSIVTKTDWEIGLGKDRMFSEITRIKTNIQKLKDAFYVLPTTPEVPSVTDVSINYIKANNIEKILKDMEYLAFQIDKSLRYADFMYAGDDLGMPDTIND